MVRGDHRDGSAQAVGDDRGPRHPGGAAATGTFPHRRRPATGDAPVPEQWPARVWAVEGADGVGRPVAQRLLADGERVLDVPAKLAARVRVFDTGHGRKTDATDAHAVVMAALRDRDGCGSSVVDERPARAAAAGRPA